MLNKFVDASKMLTEVLNVPEWPVSASVEPFQSMFDLRMSIFSRK